MGFTLTRDGRSTYHQTLIAQVPRFLNFSMGPQQILSVSSTGLEAVSLPASVAWCPKIL
jgi:hypothetical protein